MSAAALPLPSPALWAWLDPDAAAAPRADGWTALVEPDALRGYVAAAYQHILLREALLESAAAPAGPGRLDAELVAQAERGVPGAFDALVERYFPVAVAAAFAVLGEDEAAKDAAQDAFLEAAQDLNELREPAKFGNWVYGIARRKAVYALRRKRADRAALDVRAEAQRAQPRPDEPGAPLARDERAQSVRRALHELPEIYREVLVLKYLDGRSYEEIGALLGISLPAVDKRLSRAKTLLRTTLQRWAQE